MTKKEVMDFLGVSDRTVENYTAKGLLTVKYESGKTRPIAIYDEEEITKLKEKMASQTNKVHSPKTQSSEPLTNTEIPNGENPESNKALILAATKPITAGFQQMAITIDKLTQTVEYIRTNKAVAVPIESKVILTLNEASAILNLSKKKLIADIKNGKLKAAKEGKGWKIRRKDIDFYAESLW